MRLDTKTSLLKRVRLQRGPTVSSTLRSEVLASLRTSSRWGVTGVTTVSGVSGPCTLPTLVCCDAGGDRREIVPVFAVVERAEGIASVPLDETVILHPRERLTAFFDARLIAQLDGRGRSSITITPACRIGDRAVTLRGRRVTSESCAGSRADQVGAEDRAVTAAVLAAQLRFPI
jgi:hypothetical protein